MRTLVETQGRSCDQIHDQPSTEHDGDGELGANPERTAEHELLCPDTRRYERPAQTARTDTPRRRPRSGICIDTVEVTGSILVSPTTQTASIRGYFLRLAFTLD